MLFTSIAALVRQGITLNFAVQACGDQLIEVTVTPTAADPSSNKTGVSLVPKAFKATPEEFDADFPKVIAEFSGRTLSLHEQMQAANQIISNSEKAASEAAVKSTVTKAPAKATPGGKPGTKPTPKAPADPELLSSSGGTQGGEEGSDDDDGEGNDAQSPAPAPAAAPSQGASLTLEL